MNISDLSHSPQFQRYETSHRLLINEFDSMKDEIVELKKSVNDLTEENKKLRRDLKDSIAGQLFPLDLDTKLNESDLINKNESLIAIKNLEQQLNLIKKERDNSMQMWQHSLSLISQLETELKNLQFKTAPQTMSFELELKHRQEEFTRNEVNLVKEINVAKLENRKKDEELAENAIRQNELKLEIEHLKSLVNQKNTDKRNLMQKEYGYDNALITLQNDINDLETKNISFKKENQYLKDTLDDRVNKINDLNKIICELDHKITELKTQISDMANQSKNGSIELQKVKIAEQQSKQEVDRLNCAIAQLMEEAANKTRQEVEALKKLYNSNIEKLISECSMLEIDQSTKMSQLEKALRAKKTLEHEIEKIANDTQRSISRENLSHEELHRRLCAVERERDLALMKLEAKDIENKNLQATNENDKAKYNEIINDFTEKTHKSTRELEKITDEQAKLLTEIEELRNKISIIQVEKNSLQKSLTKEIQMRENESKIKETDNYNRVKNLEENHSRAMFEIRQLLNMQQRMSNKWKEECHMITNQSEVKFIEMKKNFDNLRQYNEKLLADIQLAKQKETENEHSIGIYLNKIKQLESRVKDAEYQAGEATKRIAKQVAREKMINYEKYLLESDLERTKFQDTFSRGKAYLHSIQSNNDNDIKPVKLRSNNKNESSSSND